ncbi:hypothetical protein EJA05_19825 [Pseudomonas oryziphila]|uniref:Uncharacterized protein n=1 Tax=Pseudomonas entomophila TaxID=312306 RepID=A0A3Q8U3H7_9PSED|nr:hypothetical protein EJA05_19825 [Pseudomonas oryziphila]
MLPAGFLQGAGSNCLARHSNNWAIPVGAAVRRCDSPANTGIARAKHRGVIFAGKPAPTGRAGLQPSISDMAMICSATWISFCWRLMAWRRIRV